MQRLTKEYLSGSAFPRNGHTTVERRRIIMQMKVWAITMGLGAAAGAVAIMMLPRQNPARKLASKAAYSVEDAVDKVSTKISNKMDM
jgi:hypothetical protein